MRTESAMTYKERYQLLERIGIPKPSKDMVWRVDDAIELARDGYVRFIESEHGLKHFSVRSQSNPNQVYHVSFNDKPASYCRCPDWHKHDMALHRAGIPFSLFACKHSIAARLFDHEQQRRQQSEAFDVQAAISELTMLEAEQYRISSQMTPLQHKQANIESAIRHIKQSIRSHLEATNQRRVETNTHKVTLAKMPMRVGIKSIAEIPDAFKQTQVETVVDKGAIARHIKAEGTIPEGVDVLQASYVRIMEVTS